MTMAPNKLITRDEILGGGLRGRPTKQAGALLRLIENRTAYLAVQARQTMELYLSDEAAEQRNLAFLEAIALEQELPFRPTIQDLERFAPRWAYLVAKNPRVRAAVAHLLGQRYRLAYQAVPELRATLGLDQAAVQQAYKSLYNQTLDSIFAPQVKLNDRLRWIWARMRRWLENLSPFWTAFALTLTETVGAGILALPIALAQVGPLAGVILLVVFGLVNVMTIALMAEVMTRSGSIRYGSAFLGRVVSDFLGRTPFLMVAIALFTDCFLFLLVYYIGFSTTLADVTSIPAAVWVGLLFLLGLYFVRRESLDATVASALVIGAINIGLILVLSMLASTQIELAHLLYLDLPFVTGQPFDPSILRLVFGVVLVAYYGHLSVSNCAQVVLRRDPGGRSLIWGVIAAQVAALVLYCIWVVAVNGSMDPQILANESGTVLIPLAARIGPIVHLFGTIYVILGMGMASIHFSLGLFNLTRDWLPSKPRSIVKLYRRRGQLRFHKQIFHGVKGGDDAPGVLLGLTYLGLVNNWPLFRLDIQADGITYHLEMTISERLEAETLFDRLPALSQHSFHLAVEVKEANADSVQLQADSSLRLTYHDEQDTVGMRLTDALSLPENQRRIISWLIRQEAMGREFVGLSEIAAYTGQDQAATEAVLNSLMSQGFIRGLVEAGKTRFRPQLAPKQPSRQLSTDIQQALENSFGPPTEHTANADVGLTIIQRAGILVLSEWGRSLISVSPLVLIFLLAEWFVLSGRESFTDSLNFLGVVIAPLLAGIFPVLLLVASRRKSEIDPGVVYRFLGNPLLLGGLYLLSLAGLFFYGLIIWEDPFQRAVALAVGIIILWATVRMAHQKSFTWRTVVELREDRGEGKPSSFAIRTGEQPTLAAVHLGYLNGERSLQAASGEISSFSSLDYVNFQLPVTQAREIKVWAHSVTPSGDSVGLPAMAILHCGDDKLEIDLKLSGGQIVLPRPGEPCRLEISLKPERWGIQDHSGIR